MRPFQLWLPVVEYSLAEIAADKDRVFTAWRRESRVWLLLSVKRPIRWQDGPHWWSWHIAVPAFDPRSPSPPYQNRIDIFYVENGQVSGPGGTRRFPGGCTQDLLTAWLNLELGSIGGEPRAIPEPFRLWEPCFDGPDITYREELFGGAGLSDFVTPEMSDEAHRLWEETPPVRPRSSSGNSRPQQNMAEDRVPYSLQTMLQCPQRFAALPYSKAFFKDFVAEQKKMAEIARKCEKDLIGALREAQEAAIPYITEGPIMRGVDWLWRTGPALWRSTKGDKSTAFKLLFEDAWNKFDIKTADFEEAMRSGEWPGTMGQFISIRRAWGMIGLFWALFLEELEHHQLQVCSLCGGIIQGKRGKTFCGRTDDEVCFRRRLANRKRRSRATRKQEQQD